MSVRQYIGARYVPRFSEVNNGIWSNVYSYEPLTIVKNGNDYYTSKKSVPIGVAITDTEYWALTGNYNGAIQALDTRMNAVETAISNMKDDFVNVLEYGFDNTGTSDNSALMSDLPSDVTLLFPSGTYLFNTPIVFNNYRILAYGATFKANALMSSFITLTSSTDDIRYNKDYFFIGGVIDGDYKVNNALVIDGIRAGLISTCAVKNFNSHGIEIKKGGMYISHVHINQEYELSANLPANTYGIYDVSNDTFIDNMTIVDCQTAIKCCPGGSYYNISPWLSQKALYENTVAYEIGACNCFFINCTVDTIQTGFCFKSTYGYAFIQNLFWLHNSSVVPDADVQSMTNETILFKYDNVLNTLYCDGLKIDLRGVHAKFISDSKLAIADVSNSYTTSSVHIHGVNGQNVANLSNVMVDNMHNTLSQSIISAISNNNITISNESVSFINDHITGEITLQKPGNASWDGLTLTLRNGCRFRKHIICLASVNGFGLDGTQYAYAGTNGQIAITGTNNDGYNYLTIPIDIVCTLSRSY